MTIEREPGVEYILSLSYGNEPLPAPAVEQILHQL